MNPVSEEILYPIFISESDGIDIVSDVDVVIYCEGEKELSFTMTLGMNVDFSIRGSMAFPKIQNGNITNSFIFDTHGGETFYTKE